MSTNIEYTNSDMEKNLDDLLLYNLSKLDVIGNISSGISVNKDIEQTKKLNILKNYFEISTEASRIKIVGRKRTGKKIFQKNINIKEKIKNATYEDFISKYKKYDLSFSIFETSDASFINIECSYEEISFFSILGKRIHDKRFEFIKNISKDTINYTESEIDFISSYSVLRVVPRLKNGLTDQSFFDLVVEKKLEQLPDITCFSGQSENTIMIGGLEDKSYIGETQIFRKIQGSDNLEFVGNFNPSGFFIDNDIDPTVGYEYTIKNDTSFSGDIDKFNVNSLSVDYTNLRNNFVEFNPKTNEIQISTHKKISSKNIKNFSDPIRIADYSNLSKGKSGPQKDVDDILDNGLPEFSFYHIDNNNNIISSGKVLNTESIPENVKSSKIVVIPEVFTKDSSIISLPPVFIKNQKSGKPVRDYISKDGKIKNLKKEIISGTNVLSWSTNKEYSDIDHFIIIANIGINKYISGIMHNLSNGKKYTFIDYITPKNTDVSYDIVLIDANFKISDLKTI